MVEAGSLLGPGIICTVDEGMMGIAAEDDCVQIDQDVRRDIEEVYKRLIRMDIVRLGVVE